MAKRPYHTIQEQFDEFHADNPHVYNILVSKARFFVAQGYNYLTIALLYETVRCDPSVLVSGKGHYKLCNDYRAHYARKIMAENLDLQGIFRLRQLESA
jgi:hypothetical protein